MLSLGTTAPFWVDWQSRAGWAMEGAALHLDFANGRYARDGRKVAPADVLAVDAASTRFAFDSDGVLQAFAANKPRITDLGLLVEPEVENFVPDPSFAGASVGVVGSGGALPTDWYIASVDSAEVLALWEENGMQLMRVRMQKDNSSSGSPTYPRLQPNASTRPAAAVGET